MRRREKASTAMLTPLERDSPGVSTVAPVTRKRKALESPSNEKSGDGQELHQYKKTINDSASELVCPLTQALPLDPVIAEDGRIYERRAITRWLEEHSISPVTRQPLKAEALLPAAQVRSVVECLVLSGALPAVDADSWRRDREMIEADLAVRRRADAGSGEACSLIALWHLRGTHELVASVSDWMEYAMRAANAKHDVVRLEDERYATPRAGAELARLLDKAEYLEKGRGILVSWMVEVQSAYRLATETLYLAVHHLDRYLASSASSASSRLTTSYHRWWRTRVQLVGVACLKQAELTLETGKSDLVTSDEYAYVTDHTYTRAEVDAMQRTISDFLGEDHRAVATSRTYLDGLWAFLETQDFFNPRLFLLSKYLLELTLPELRFVAEPPYALAVAALRLAAHLRDLKAEDGSGFLRTLDGHLQDSGCYSQAVREDINSCTRELRILHAKKHARVREWEEEHGDYHGLCSIYDKYADDDVFYLEIAKDAQPASRCPPKLATRGSLRHGRRVSAPR